MREKGLTAFVLKLAAIIGMTACHVATVFAGRIPFAAYCAGIALGGVTFPVMAFLVSEGYRHTSDLRRYMLRLGVWAVVAQVPYALVFEPVAVDWGGAAHALPFTGNVLFTLLLGLALLYLYDHMQNRLGFAAVCALAVAGSVVLDWGVVGPVMILAAHVLPNGWRRRVIPACIPLVALGLPALADCLALGTPALPVLLYEAVGGTLAIALLAHYNGLRGPQIKRLFYLYYPAHLFVLYVLSVLP